MKALRAASAAETFISLMKDCPNATLTIMRHAVLVETIRRKAEDLNFDRRPLRKRERDLILVQARAEVLAEVNEI